MSLTDSIPEGVQGGGETKEGRAAGLVWAAQVFAWFPVLWLGCGHLGILPSTAQQSLLLVCSSAPQLWSLHSAFLAPALHWSVYAWIPETPPFLHTTQGADWI
jgi:hypothetical protein